MRIFLKYKKERVNVDLKVCNCFERFLGLMFAKKEKAKALLFDFKKSVKIPIHSFFVFFPFIAIWLDGKNKIIGLKIIKPFRFCVCPKNFFSKLIEIPVNRRYNNVVTVLCSSVTRKI